MTAQVVRRDGHGRPADVWGLGSVALAMLALVTPLGTGLRAQPDLDDLLRLATVRRLTTSV